MSRDHLDDHLRRHYGSQQVDPTVLERLNRLAHLEESRAGTTLSDPRPALDRRVLSHLAAMAAAIAALVLFSLILPDLRETGMEHPKDLAGSVLQEIALNHGKNLMVEFPATEYPRLRELMGELDFALRPPHAGASGLQMLGGRYCSIQGRLAAQIKLEDERGRVLTLYQTSFGEHFDGLPELRRELDGVEIRVWREDDLLFALAGPES